MALLGDWDGDGVEDFDDDIIEMLVLEDAIEYAEKKQGNDNSGGGCLTSLVIMVLPFIAVGCLLSSWI